MNRWIPALSTIVLATAAFAAQAQALVRMAPEGVVAARMTVTQPPEVKLGDKVERLSPGARIRGVNNMLVLSGTWAGKTVPVVYRRDTVGNVHEIWELTEAEYAKVSGIDASTPDGARKYVEALNQVFGTRP